MPTDRTDKAAFLDKDGTLIENIPYNVDVTRMHLLDGVAEGLKLLSQAGFLMIVISNQAGVAKGYFPENALEPVEQRVREMFRDAGVDLAGFYYCPHHAEGIVPQYRGACDCRKPEPGMLLRAARERNLDLEKSWMIGDSESDVEAGRRVGCQTALITGGGAGKSIGGATVVRASFQEAASAIVSRDAAVLGDRARS